MVPRISFTCLIGQHTVIQFISKIFNMQPITPLAVRFSRSSYLPGVTTSVPLRILLSCCSLPPSLREVKLNGLRLSPACQSLGSLARWSLLIRNGENHEHAFRAWKPGQKSKNNGVILFIFVQDRKIRIETGLCLEHELPNSLCKIIISDQIGPRFKAGDYNGGLNAAIDSIVTATR